MPEKKRVFLDRSVVNIHTIGGGAESKELKEDVERESPKKRRGTV